MGSMGPWGDVVKTTSFQIKLGIMTENVGKF